MALADAILLRSVAQDYRNNVPSQVREKLIELADKLTPAKAHKCATCRTPLARGEPWCWYCGQLTLS